MVMDSPAKKATHENICVGKCLREDYTMEKLALSLFFYTDPKMLKRKEKQMPRVSPWMNTQ